MKNSLVKKLEALGMFTLLVLSACSSDDDAAAIVPQNPPPTDPAVALEAAGTGEVQSLKVETSDSWIAQSDADWCILSSESGQGAAEISISVLPNRTGTARTANVSIAAPTSVRAASNSAKAYTVTQQPDPSTEPAVVLTALSRDSLNLNVTLCAYGQKGVYSGISGLSRPDASSGQPTKDPIVYENLPANTPYTFTVLGPDSRFSGIIRGDENGPVTVTIATSPALGQKLYIDQSQTLSHQGIRMPAASSGMIHFALGNKVYFGGGLSRLSYNGSQGLSPGYNGVAFSRAFYVYDASAVQCNILPDLTEAQAAGWAAATDSKAYLLDADACLYTFSNTDATWQLQAEHLADSCSGFFCLGEQLYVVRGTRALVFDGQGNLLRVENGFPACERLEPLRESRRRVWWACNNRLYKLEEGGQPTPVTYIGSNELAGAYDGKVYYRENGGVSVYDDNTGVTLSNQLFFLPVSCDGGAYDAYTAYGYPVMAGGKSYIVGGHRRMGTIDWTISAYADGLYILNCASFKAYSAIVR